MLANFLHTYRSSLQFKLFLSLTAIVACSMAVTLASQIYLVQDYFVRQAENNLRSSNYLLSRVLADPLFERDLALLQARLREIQTKLTPCSMQLKDDSGNVLFKKGETAGLDANFDPDSRDGCYNTIVPVVHGTQNYGMLRLGVRTSEIADARQDLIEKSVLIAALSFALFMLPFFLQIRRMMRPLVQLAESTRQFADGNLCHPPPSVLPGNDVLAQLTGNFQRMAQNLLTNNDWQAACMDALNKEKQMLDTLLSSLPVGVFFADHTHIRYCNDSFRKMWHIDPQEQLVGMQNNALLSRVGPVVEEPDELLAAVAEILETRAHTPARYVTLKNGRILRMTSNVVVAPESRGYLGRFWMFEDVTHERNEFLLAEQRANQDALTQLHNRQHFDQEFPRLCAQAERAGAPLVLMMFDLDDFKPVNDRFGHAAGDSVLKGVAQALLQQLRRNEVLYRIGGDEFALLLPNSSDKEAAILAGRIVQTIRSLEFDFEGLQTQVGCSLGIARYPLDADTPPELLAKADRAMYLAKQRGKSQWVMGESQ